MTVSSGDALSLVEGVADSPIQTIVETSPSLSDSMVEEIVHLLTTLNETCLYIAGQLDLLLAVLVTVLISAIFYICLSKFTRF